MAAGPASAEETQSRRAALLLAIGLTALALVIGIIAWLDFAAMIGDLRRNAAVVTIPIGGAVALPLVPILTGIVTIAAGRHSDRRDGRIFVAVLCGFPLMVVMPLGLGLWSNAALPDRGYVRCRTADHGGRYPTAIWTRGAAACRAIDAR